MAHGNARLGPAGRRELVRLMIEQGSSGTLISHLAAANPQASLIRAGVGMMAIFLGQSAYVSASWFKQRDSAPTWAYAAAHCHGHPVVQNHQDSLRNIARLVDTREGGRANRCHLRELGPDGLSDRMPRIVCFELPIERVEARFQLGQEERPADIAGAADALSRQGNQELASLSGPTTVAAAERLPEQLPPSWRRPKSRAGRPAAPSGPPFVRCRGAGSTEAGAIDRPQTISRAYRKLHTR